MPSTLFNWAAAPALDLTSSCSSSFIFISSLYFLYLLIIFIFICSSYSILICSCKGSRSNFLIIFYHRFQSIGMGGRPQYLTQLIDIMLSLLLRFASLYKVAKSMAVCHGGSWSRAWIGYGVYFCLFFSIRLFFICLWRWGDLNYRDVYLVDHKAGQGTI